MNARARCWIGGLGLWQAASASGWEIVPPYTGEGAPGDYFGAASASSSSALMVGAYVDVLPSREEPFGVIAGAVYVFDAPSAAQRHRRLQAAVPESGALFGYSLASCADYLVVGAPHQTVAGRERAGAVHLFRGSGLDYTRIAELGPPEPNIGGQFGWALACDGDRLAIGSPGKAEVVRARLSPSGFTVLERLFDPDPGQSQRFGASLALRGTVLVVGAPGAPPQAGKPGDARGRVLLYRDPSSTGPSDVGTEPVQGFAAAVALAEGRLAVGSPNAAGSGEVLLYRLDGAGLGAALRLRPQAAPPGARFGQALLWQGEELYVGAPEHDLGLQSAAGAVFRYGPEHSGGGLAQIERFEAASGGQAQLVGQSLTAFQGRIWAGAPLDDVGRNEAQGSVYGFASGRPAVRLELGIGASYDRFGSAVALDGGHALVGAFLENGVAGIDSGNAHLYRRTEDGALGYVSALTPADLATEDRYGLSAALSGDWALVGAYWKTIAERIDQGAAYLWQRQGEQWVQAARLVASDGRARDFFGFAVALDGPVAVVGARGRDQLLPDDGVVYVYRRGGSGVWSEVARLAAPDPETGAAFGAAVAVRAGRIVIGAPGRSVGGEPQRGRAYVFEDRDGRILLAAVLDAPEPGAGQGFGISVALDQERLAIGAAQAEAAGRPAAGRVYVYRWRGAPVLEAGLAAPEPQPGARFGTSVALDGTRLLVGAPAHDRADRIDQGRAYLFHLRDGRWRLSSELFDPQGGDFDQYGRSVALSGAELLIGAWARARANPLEGGAYWLVDDALHADGFEGE